MTEQDWDSRTEPIYPEIECPSCYLDMLHTPTPDYPQLHNCRIHGSFDMAHFADDDAYADEDEIIRMMEK